MFIVGFLLGTIFGSLVGIGSLILFRSKKPPVIGRGYLLTTTKDTVHVRIHERDKVHKKVLVSVERVASSSVYRADNLRDQFDLAWVDAKDIHELSSSPHSSPTVDLTEE